MHLFARRSAPPARLCVLFSFLAACGADSPLPSFGSGASTADAGACAGLRDSYYDEVSSARAMDVAGRVGGGVLGGVLDRTLGNIFGGGGNALTAELQSELRESLSKLGASIQESAQRTQEFNAAFNALYDCRTREAREINQLRRDGLLGQAEAEARMARLRTLTQEDVAAAQGVRREISERQDEFRVAAQRARGAAQEAPPEERAQLEREVAQIEAQIDTNQRVYQAAAQDVQAAETQVASGGGPFVVSSAPRARAVLPA
jgi:hypothetical protein